VVDYLPTFFLNPQKKGPWERHQEGRRLGKGKGRGNKVINLSRFGEEGEARPSTGGGKNGEPYETPWGGTPDGEVASVSQKHDSPSMAE